MTHLGVDWARKQRLLLTRVIHLILRGIAVFHLRVHQDGNNGAGGANTVHGRIGGGLLRLPHYTEVATAPAGEHIDGAPDGEAEAHADGLDDEGARRVANGPPTNRPSQNATHTEVAAGITMWGCAYPAPPSIAIGWSGGAPRTTKW